MGRLELAAAAELAAADAIADQRSSKKTLQLLFLKSLSFLNARATRIDYQMLISPLLTYHHSTQHLRLRQI